MRHKSRTHAGVADLHLRLEYVIMTPVKGVKHMQERISINHIPGISAIYFALLQCGYGYYAMEKEADLAKRVETFCMTQNSLLHPFFLNVKQNTCAVYPYWSRAALLESATFFLDHGTTQLKYYEAFRQHVMSMSNLSETERNEDFWAWIADFPAALTAVLGSSEFRAYWHWEHDWIMQQNMVWEHELHQIESILHTCAVRYRAPKRTVSVILNPIKCVYSADYHIKGSHLIVCSGAFSPQSVVHECLHPIVAQLWKRTRKLFCNARYHAPILTALTIWTATRTAGRMHLRSMRCASSPPLSSRATFRKTFTIILHRCCAACHKPPRAPHGASADHRAHKHHKRYGRYRKNGRDGDKAGGVAFIHIIHGTKHGRRRRHRAAAG